MKAGEIAAFLAGELLGDPEADVVRAASIEKGGDGSLVFTEHAVSSMQTAAACLLAPDDQEWVENTRSLIRVHQPKLAFARMGSILHPPKLRPAEIHPTAVIAESAKLGADVFVGAFASIGEGSTIGARTQLRAGAKIGDNVVIGSGCTLDPNVFVEDDCTIGDNVILHTGVVIGTDGFGFVRDADGYHKFPQIGTVVIEDDVEIGANTCVDRGALGETRIGAGSKLDNLIQVGHNVRIGRRVVIAAQTGISGSTVIEDDCVIGGQVGMGDHATVQSGAVIGSQAGVLPGKIVRPGVWWGTPVQPLEEYKRQNAHIKGLARLKDEIKELRRKLSD